MSTIMLRTAAQRISMAFALCEKALRDGAYDGLVEPSRGYRGRDVLRRVRIAPDRLPAFRDASWDWVLYDRPGGRDWKSGPWVNTDAVRKWLNAQVSMRAKAAVREANPAVLKHLAGDLDIDPRRLYAWLSGPYEHIPYCHLEDALWAYGCMRPEDIVSRDDMIISKPSKGNRPMNRKKAS